MPNQQLFLNPSDNYQTKPNASFKAQWPMLADEAQTIVAAHLTHLDLMHWLRENLRYQDQYAQFKPLWLNLGEGFDKTIVLSYASICELALHDIIKRFYASHQNTCSDTVKSCFQRDDDTYYEFSKEVTAEFPNNQRLTTKLYGRKRETRAVQDHEVTFNQLIAAAHSAGIVDDTFKARLHGLRTKRNGVHLSQHAIKKGGATIYYDETMAQEAKDVTDELKILLQQFVLQFQL